MTKPTKVTAGDVLDAIRVSFNSREYAVLANVRNGTGYAQKRERYADALALSLWPSKGIELHGFEIKVARSDWLNELKDPEKSHEIGRFCHRWWVAAPPGVVKLEEVPTQWGYLEVTEKRTARKVQAPLRETEAWTVGFVASVFRSFAEQCIARSEADRMVADATKRFADDASKAWDLERQLDSKKRDLETQAQHHAHYRQGIVAFEQSSGLTLQQSYNWDLGKVGTIVAMLMRGDKALDEAMASATSASERYRELAEELKTLRERIGRVKASGDAEDAAE
ncbi:MAG: hypothetical protein HOW73_47985 [Polyangiaceae bacterium]|nr:hypothetical protein [Polyangiaceae bacterium]